MTNFKTEIMSDSRAQSRVRAVNKLLEDLPQENVWESLFFAIWYAEMGRGCEEIISSVVRVCHTDWSLAKQGLRALADKWFGLDQFRIDKISHLARHLVCVTIERQIRVRLASTSGGTCNKLILTMLDDISKASGLCYFVLGCFVDEFRRAMVNVCASEQIAFGHDKLKSKILGFVYQQFIVFAARQGNDQRFMKTLERSIFKAMIAQHLSHESQTTQLMVTLGMRDVFRRYASKSGGKLTLNRSLRIRFGHWQELMDRTHESCVAGEHFVVSSLPHAVEIDVYHRQMDDSGKKPPKKKAKH